MTGQGPSAGWKLLESSLRVAVITAGGAFGSYVLDHVQMALSGNWKAAIFGALTAAMVAETQLIRARAQAAGVKDLSIGPGAG